MTLQRPRAPLSIDSALARIAGQLPGGWADMAAIANRAESHVRKWGDEHQPEAIPLPCAIALDIAFRRAGGAGRPCFDVYQSQLEIAEADAFQDQAEIAAHTVDLVRESGEAIQALIEATLPGAGPVQERKALGELEGLDQLVDVVIARLASRRQAAQPP